MDIILYKKSGTARLFQVQAVPITNDEGMMDPFTASIPKRLELGSNISFDRTSTEVNRGYSRRNVTRSTGPRQL